MPESLTQTVKIEPFIGSKYTIPFIQSQKLVYIYI